MSPPDPGRVEVRLLRRLPADPARLRGRAARRSPGGCAIAHFLEASAQCAARPVRRVARRGLDHHARRRRADPARPRASHGADHDRRLRHGRRHPGAAQLRRRRGVPLPPSTPARSTSTRSPRPPRSPRTCRSTSSCAAARSTSGQLLEVITAYLAGRKPDIPDTSVCTECKRRGLTCVMVADGTPCLGPVTHAGCGALCPAVRRGCYGCFGPMTGANLPALIPLLQPCGMDERRRRPGVRHVQRGRTGFARAEEQRPMSHRDRQLQVSSLARVEGEGALRVVVDGDEVAACRAADLRAAPVLRGVPARPAAHRGHRHHLAHLRHLPGRVPDQRLERDRGRVRGRRRRAASARCGGCCTAASGSPATRCTSTCCTRRTSSATRTRSLWRRTTAKPSSADCR